MDKSVGTTESKKGCLPCRLVGAVGLSGAGTYVLMQVKRQSGGAAKAVVSAFGGGLIYLGVARLLDLPPFPHLRDEQRS